MLVLSASSSAQVTQRVSVTTDGRESNRWSIGLGISADGRLVTLWSNAGNLAAGDTNGLLDVYLRDRVRGSTEAVSVDPNGIPGNGESRGAHLTPDGGYVAFTSLASNLVPGDANFRSDAFVRNLALGTTELVSKSSTGVVGNGDSESGPPTHDGRFVCFSSFASNLVPGVPAGFSQVYVRDRVNGTTQVVSVSSAGTAGNGMSRRCDISEDGRFVAFLSEASNLVPGDTNTDVDLFVHDRQTHTTRRESVPTGGTQAGGNCQELAMTGDGRFIAFVSDSLDLVPGIPVVRFHVYVRDRQLGTTELASATSGGAPANGHCFSPGISDDGAQVVFVSSANNLVPADSNQSDDVFLHDRRSGATTRVSVSSAGAQGEFSSFGSAISAGGDYVVFGSAATRLVPGDGNEFSDAFLRILSGGTTFTSLCSPGVDGVSACPCSNRPSDVDRGCDNSADTGGAWLAASGGAFLSSDSLALTTRGEWPTALSIVMQGSEAIANGLVYGQGIRCAGGRLTRLFSKNAVAGSITAPDFGAGDPTITAVSAAKGDPIGSGQSRWYLVFYRDPFGIGACTASSTFNATQTGQVTWSP